MPDPEPTELTTTEARGGSRGGVIRTMLIVSIALAVIAFIILLLMFGAPV